MNDFMKIPLVGVCLRDFNMREESSGDRKLVAWMCCSTGLLGYHPSGAVYTFRYIYLIQSND